MRYPLLLLVFIFLSMRIFGQSNIDSTIERELEIRISYFQKYHKLVNTAYQNIKDRTLPIPYFIGDEFVLTDTILISTFLKNDGTIAFDIKEDGRSVIPQGYKVKLIKKEGYYFHIQVRSEDIIDIRNEIIPEEQLLSYFDPNYLSKKAMLFSEIELIEKRLAKELSVEFNVSIEEIDRIRQTEYFFEQKDR